MNPYRIEGFFCLRTHLQNGRIPRYSSLVGENARLFVGPKLSLDLQLQTHYVKSMKSLRFLFTLLLPTIPATSIQAEPPPIRHSFLATGSSTYIFEEAASTAEKSTESKASDRKDIVFETWERDTYAPWTVEGTAFGDSPLKVADMPAYQGDVKAVGKRLVNSHHTRNGEEVGAGDRHLGTLTSAPFEIERPYIRMRIGGGGHKGRTCVELLIDNQAVAELTGENQNTMREKSMDVRNWIGKSARLRIADRVEKSWGNIGVDQIVFSDQPADSSSPAGTSGKVIWEVRVGSRDGWVLDSGNVLLALGNSRVHPGGAIAEYTQDGKMVFEYKGTQKEVQAVQPLGTNRILAVEGGKNPVLLELDRATAQPVVRLPLQCQKGNVHMQTRMARKLPNGNYLVPHLLDFAVKEYDPSGKVVRSFATDDQGRDKKSWPFTAIRLDNGHTLVGCTYAGRVIEFDAEGKIVWQLTNEDLPQPLIKDACGVQRLPNGNTVVCCYGARGPQAIKLIEVTPEKQLVWTHKTGKNHGVHHVQILSTRGKAFTAAERSMR